MIPLGVLASARVAAAGGGGVTFTGPYQSTTTGKTHTITGVDIGAASSDRVVIVTIGTRPTVALGSVTIGGVSAVRDADSTGDSGSGRIEIWRASVPTGTTATVVVTTAAGDPSDGVALGVYTVTGYAVAPIDSDYQRPGSSGAQTPSRTLDTAAGGLLVAAAYKHYNIASDATWTGATEDFDGEYGKDHYTSAHAYPTAAGTLTVSVYIPTTYYAATAFASYSLT